MAVKNFDFGKNWVGSEVASTYEHSLFCHFWPNSLDSHFGPNWGPNMGFFKHNFDFQSLRKTEVILLPNM